MKNPLLIYLDEVTSTGSYLRNLTQLMPSTEKGVVVYTDFQTAGRGQRGNSWESERAKNLTFSMLLHLEGVKADRSFVVSQLVSLAIKGVLDKYTDHVSIKWPNDIYWNDQKIAGILIENDIMGDYIQQSIIGIGLNLNQEHFQSNAPNPVSLKQITGDTYVVKDILGQILQRLSYYYSVIQSQASSIRAAYKQSLYRKEGYHGYADANGAFLAQITDVEDSGLLVLQLDSGEVRRYAFKEVSYLL